MKTKERPIDKKPNSGSATGTREKKWITGSVSTIKRIQDRPSLPMSADEKWEDFKKPPFGEENCRELS